MFLSAYGCQTGCQVPLSLRVYWRYKKSCLLTLLNINFHNSSLFPLAYALSVRAFLLPASLKKAIVTPKQKKPNLDKDGLANVRPMLNLPFISKLLENVITIRLAKYLYGNKQLPKHQLAYENLPEDRFFFFQLLTDVIFEVKTGELIC